MKFPARITLNVTTKSTENHRPLTLLRQAEEVEIELLKSHINGPSVVRGPKGFSQGSFLDEAVKGYMQIEERDDLPF